MKKAISKVPRRFYAVSKSKILDPLFFGSQ